MLKYLSEMLDLIGERLIHTDVTDRKYTKQFDFAKLKAKDKNELGRGVFAKVVPNNKDPHSVVKKTKVPFGDKHTFKKDGFKSFTELLGEGDIADNIHFPRVYKVDTVTDRNGTQRHEFEVERLVALSDLSTEEVRAVAEVHFDVEIKSLKQLASIVSNACESLNTKYIRSDSLAEACLILGKYEKKHRIGLDLHSDNLMVRRSPHGYILVINDPFLSSTFDDEEFEF